MFAVIENSLHQSGTERAQVLDTFRSETDAQVYADMKSTLDGYISLVFNRWYTVAKIA